MGTKSVVIKSFFHLSISHKESASIYLPGADALSSKQVQSLNSLNFLVALPLPILLDD